MAARENKNADSSKATEVENTAPTDETTPSRDTEGVENRTDEVSGQNHPAAVPADERDAREQYAAVLRENEADLPLTEDVAGDEYLYPNLPVNAQNPPKRNVIAYKHDPTGEANNS